MGRAIVRDPQVFLMDEPLSNLDAKLRIQMRAEILRLQRRLRTTMVYVTHDQTEAMTLGDRVAVMRAGLLQQVGTPNELYDRPANAFVAGFIGAPAMNFLAGEVSRGELRSALGTVALGQARGASGSAPRDGRVVVGIRPEDLYDAARAPRDDGGVVVRAIIDVLESTGSDLYAHLTLPHANGAPAPELPTAPGLAAAATDGSEEDMPTSPDMIARLDVTSRVAEGQEADLWVDASRLHLFAPDSGERI
jgi:multiple sugar transport system ATP-binding protein